MHLLQYSFILVNLLIGVFSCVAETAVVSRVIDGDTFEIESGEKIRLIGINAPEISDFFGVESKCFLENVLLSKQVELVEDPLSTKYDRYQRKLCYVYIDGIDMNAKMINEGYAFAYLKFKFSKSKEYEELQVFAMKNNKGIWGVGQKQLDGDGSIEHENNGLVKESKTTYNISPKRLVLGTLTFLLFVLLFYFLLKK